MKKKKRSAPAPAPAPASAPIQDEASLGSSAMAQRPAFRLWTPDARDADSVDAWERADQRAWSRELDRTSPAARSGLDQHCAYRVGTGLRYQARINASELGLSEVQASEWQDLAERRFDMWASSPMASVEGDQNFYEMQRLIALSQEMSGDVYALITRKERQNGWPFRTAIQIFESDRICNENNAANTQKIYEGIERAADGEIVAVFVANHHPGGMANIVTNKKWERIAIFSDNGRRNILFRKNMRRPCQSRGMPALSVITGTIKQHTRYTEAEIEAAVNSAAMAIFAQMDPQSFQDLFTPSEREAYISAALSFRTGDTPMSSGKILNTMPGETITSPTPGRPNPNFGPFVENFYTFIGMGLSMPPEVLTGLFKSSYTAAQAALQQLWQTIKIIRASDVTHICQPVLESWLFDCVADGILEAPGFLVDPFIRHAWCGSQWSGSGPASLNPLDEAKAAQIRAGFLTTEADETINYDGGDWSTRHQQRTREAQARRDGDLPPLAGGPSASGATPEPAQPNQQQQPTQP